MKMTLEPVTDTDKDIKNYLKIISFWDNGWKKK